MVLIESAHDFINGWLVHYNYLRPHTALKDKTPAEVAGIKCPLHNWRDVVEQPFEVTARIPIRLVSSSSRKPKRKAAKHKITKHRTATPTLSVVRMR